MKKHTILFLAANPSGIDPRALDQEARSIQDELERSGQRDRFELVTRWAVKPLDLLRELRKLKPTVVHYSGHSGQNGMFFQAADGRAQLVSTTALAQTFGAVGAPVKLVVLNACYSAAQAEALLAHVDCIVGMGGSIHDDAATSFAIGFYGALGERESVAAAYQQGCAAISLEGRPEGDRPQLKVRDGVDANQLVLAAAASSPSLTRAGLIDFTAERQRHTRFVGRAALLARLDQLLIADRTDRWVVVTGGPGMGKSALLSAWLTRREAAGAVVPHHFIRRGEYDWDVPAKLVASLVAQLEERFPNLHEPEADVRKHPAARLAAMLTRVSMMELVPSGERLVILIDGLDEYDPLTGTSAGDPLAAFLPHSLPDGVSLLCASRPRHPYVSSLSARDCELVQIDLDDPGSSLDNDATVRAFWEQAAPPLGLDTRFIDDAVACAGGNVQHAATLQRHLAVLLAEQRRVENIPRSLAALLEKSWQRIATDPAVVDGLGVLCAARETLTLDELGAVAGWTSDAQRRSFMRGARELLIEALRSNGQDEYRLHHDSIRAYIAKALGATALHGHHAALARRLATWPPPVEAAARGYALRHALLHRVEAGDWADAWRLAADMGFLDAKCRELGVHEAETDVARAAERCRVSGDQALCWRFDDLARVLARESHWLRDEPEDIAALVWNRLRRSGWNAAEIDDQLRIPAHVSFLRIRHGAAREHPTLMRDLIGHGHHVNACAVTPDGRRVISASHDGTLRIWDLKSGRALAILQGHAGPVMACAVTADGRRVVSASSDGTLKVWDLEGRCAVVTLEGHADRVWGCAVTMDGRRVVSASGDRTLKVWDLECGRTLASLEGHTGGVSACAVTADGRRVVSASGDQTLKVWDLETGRALTTLEGHTRAVNACAVTADGRRVVSASSDRTLKVWDLESGRALATLEDHGERVWGCTVTMDGRRVISASWDQTLKIWDLESGHVLATLQGHTGGVSACAVTADGRHMVSASEDRMLKVWDLESGRALIAAEGHTGVVSACTVTADSQHAISASEDGTLKVWDTASGRPLAILKGHAGAVNACAVTADGMRAVSASNDGTLRVWDLKSGRALETLEVERGRVFACAVAVGGRWVASTSDWVLKVWDLQSGQLFATLKDYAGDVRACAVTADGRRVVSASESALKVWDLESALTVPRRGFTLVHDRVPKVWNLEGGDTFTPESRADDLQECAVTMDGRHIVSKHADGTRKIWDVESGRPLVILERDPGGVSACAVTVDGRRMVSAGWNSLEVWDLESGHLLAILEHQAGPVTAHAVTADGRRVVSASKDGTLKVWDLEVLISGFDSRLELSKDGMRKIWDLESRRALATLEGHTSRVTACTVTLDGRRVVSASDDRTLKVWDLESGRALATLEGHTDTVNACVVTADGQRVVSASADGTLKVWDLESGRALATLEGHTRGVAACAVAVDGRRAVSASWDMTLKVWDLESGCALVTLEHVGEVDTCAVTADGRRIVTAASDQAPKVWDLEGGTQKLWDLEGGQELAPTLGHLGGVALSQHSETSAISSLADSPDHRDVNSSVLCFSHPSPRLEISLFTRTRAYSLCVVSPDGRRLVSVLGSGPMKVWDLDSGRMIATLAGHADRVMACAVTEDGRRMISASMDRTLKVWDFETYACLFTHRGDAAYTAVAATVTAIVAGDANGVVWFLDWPTQKVGT